MLRNSLHSSIKKKQQQHWYHIHCVLCGNIATKSLHGSLFLSLSRCVCVSLAICRLQRMFSMHLTKSLQMNSLLPLRFTVHTLPRDKSLLFASLLIPILRAECTLLTSITYTVRGLIFNPKCNGALLAWHRKPTNKIFQPNCICYVNIHIWKQTKCLHDQNEDGEGKKNQKQNLGNKSIFLKTCTSITWHFYSSRAHNTHQQHIHRILTLFYRTFYILNDCVSVVGSSVSHQNTHINKLTHWLCVLETTQMNQRKMQAVAMTAKSIYLKNLSTE